MKIILVILSALLLGACTIIKPTEHTETSDVKTITLIDTTFIYTGSFINNSQQIDSIYELLLQKKADNPNLKSSENIVKYTDPESKVQLSFWIDEYGKLQAKCESKDAQFMAQLQSIEHKIIQNKTVIKEKKNIWAKVAANAGLMSTAILLILLIINLKFKK